MDNDLVDFAMQCPVAFKLNNLNEVLRINENEAGSKKNSFFTKTKDGKQILRNMMIRYIPKEIVEAKKQGFSSPDASWFKGESIDFVRRKLFSQSVRLYKFLERDAVIGLVDHHLVGSENRRLLIWSLLNVETWLEQMDV